MECIEARECFSEYIDGFLDTQVRKRLEKHLLGCAGCREELSMLNTLICDLGALDPVHAPEDFLEKLHDRMESGFRFGRIMRALFVPLKIKIPLELATAAAMAVLVFSIWNIQQREPGVMPFPKAQKHERIANETGPDLPVPSSVEKVFPSESAFEESGRSRPGKTPDKFGEGSDGVPSKTRGGIKSAKNRPASRGTQVKEPQKTALPLEGETRPLELILLVKADLSGEAPAPCQDLETSAPPKGTGEIDEQRVLVAPLPKKKATREESPRAIMRTGEGAEKRPDRVSSFRRGPSLSKDDADSPLSPLDETWFKVKEVVRLFNGKVLSQKHDKETGQPRSLTALIPSGNYHAFYEKLERLAPFQTSPPSLPEQDREFVLVRIRFLSQ